VENNVFDFVVTLQNKNHKWANFISSLLLLAAATAFGYTAIYTPEQRIMFAVWAAVIVAYTIYIHFVTGTYRLALIIAGIGFFMYPLHNYWIGALYVIVSILERQIKFPKEVGFNGEGVTFNSFPKKAFPWQAISNVVLKDGILTIDFASNKLMQQPIEEAIAIQLEREFNDFCKQQLQEHNGTSII
jgi:hypothetical protein